MEKRNQGIETESETKFESRYNFESQEMKNKLWREGTDWLQLEIRTLERKVESIERILKQKTVEGSETSSLQTKKKKLNSLIATYSQVIKKHRWENFETFIFSFIIMALVFLFYSFVSNDQNSE